MLFCIFAQIIQAGIKLLQQASHVDSALISHLGSGLLISCYGQQLRVPTVKSALTWSP